MLNPRIPRPPRPVEIEVAQRPPRLVDIRVEDNGSSAVNNTNNDTKGTFNPTEWNDKLQNGQITFAEFIEKLNELDISYQVYPCANNKNKANIKYEYDDFPYVFNVDKSIINGAAPKPDEPSVPKFKKEELAGLDDKAVQRYFTVNADGTYSLNEANVKADFPEEDYGKIDTPAQLKEAVAKKEEADKTDSAEGPDGIDGAVNNAKGDFSTINELSNFLFGTLRSDADIKNLKFDKGFNYEQIAEVVRNRHKEDFASVTKEQLKAEFLEEYNKKVGGANSTGETGGTTRTDDNTLNTYEALKQYVQSLKSSMTGEPYKTYFDKASTTVLSRHNTAKFQSVTKAQIEVEIKAECEALKKADDDKAAVENAKYAGVKNAATEMSNDFTKDIRRGNILNDLDYRISEDIETNYSINADGTLNLNNAKAKKVFDKIIEELKRYYSDAITKLGGDTVLKQLVSAAWMQAANNSNDKLDFGKVNLGTFMENVLNNMNTILKNLSSNPELLEFYTRTPASKNGDLTKNLTHYNTNDTYGNDEIIGYGNGFVDSKDYKDLTETKNDLKARIRKAYPHINSTTLDSLVDKAFTDALKKLWNGGNTPISLSSWNGKKQQINMDDLVNLALYYFDIELFDYISKNPTTAYKE